MKTITVKTDARETFVDVTRLVAGAVGEAGVAEGICTVYVPHTTAGVTINENADPDVVRDMLRFLSSTVPRGWGFDHAEGNSDAHIKASLMGFSQQIPISGGRLALGTWQGIYFTEFDGPRTRKLHVSIQKAL